MQALQDNPRDSLSQVRVVNTIVITTAGDLRAFTNLHLNHMHVDY